MAPFHRAAGGAFCVMRTIQCEVCGKKPAVSLSAFHGGNLQGLWAWMNVCDCSIETEDYYIPLTGRNGIFGGYGVHRWLRHMKRKPWFSQTLFIDAIRRNQTGKEAANA